jgi:hypothetical protein
MSLRRRDRKSALLAAVLGVGLAGPGCGDGSLIDWDEDRTVVDQRAWNLDPLTPMAIDISFIGLYGIGEGTVDAVVEWNLASNNVNMYVTAVACTREIFNAGRCGFKAKADGTSKPERVAFGVTAGERYRFWIVNAGPQRESGTFLATLTPD